MSGVENKVIIITGASSGIGEAAARKLIAGGAKLMLAARRENRLQALTDELGENAAYCVTDVTQQDQVQALAQATLARFGRIDVLINNAGLMPLSFLAKGKIDEWDRMIDVNIKGVLYGINSVLGTMLEQENGHVLNVSSVAGHKVFPSSAVYSGTKFAVQAISEGLRQESSGKIRVTTICPGATKTDLRDTITDEDVKKRFSDIGEVFISTDIVSDAILYALSQPEDVALNEIIIQPFKPFHLNQ